MNTIESQDLEFDIECGGHGKDASKTGKFSREEEKRIKVIALAVATFAATMLALAMIFFFSVNNTKSTTTELIRQYRPLLTNLNLLSELEEGSFFKSKRLRS